jgi:hypothetical protein
VRWFIGMCINLSLAQLISPVSSGVYGDALAAAASVAVESRYVRGVRHGYIFDGRRIVSSSSSSAFNFF